MAFEELKDPKIKQMLEYAPNQDAQIALLKQFSNKYSGFRDGSSFILRDKVSGEEISIPQPKGDYYSQKNIKERQSKYKDKIKIIPDVSDVENAVPPLKPFVETVKEDWGPIAGGTALPLLGLASATPPSLLAMAGLGAAGSVLGKMAQRGVENKPILPQKNDKQSISADESLKMYGKEALLGAGGEIGGRAVGKGLKFISDKLAKAGTKSSPVTLESINTSIQRNVDPNILASGTRNQIEKEVSKIDDLINKQIESFTDDDPLTQKRFIVLKDFYDKIVKGKSLTIDDIMKTDFNKTAKEVVSDLKKFGVDISPTDESKFYLESVVADLNTLKQAIKASQKQYPKSTGLRLFEKSIEPSQRFASQYGLRLSDKVKDMLRGDQ